MGKFCTFCGKQIEDGGICACREQVATNDVVQPQFQTPQASQPPQQPQQQAQQFQQQPQQPQQFQQQPQQIHQQPGVVIINGNQFGKFCMNMLGLFKRFLKSPADLIKLVAKNQDFKAGLFYAAIQCILTSLAVLLFVNKGVGAISSIFGVSSYSSIFSLNVDIPYLSIFFKTLVFMMVQFFLLAGIIFGIGKIFKGGNSFAGVIGVIGVSSIPVSLAILASVLFAFVYPSIILLLLVFGIFMSLLVVTAGVSEALQIKENNIIYVISISYFAYYLLIFAVIT